MNENLEQRRPRGRSEPPADPSRSRLSMHEGVTAACDCCSCEAEPYWVEVAEELGIELESAGVLPSGKDDQETQG